MSGTLNVTVTFNEQAASTRSPPTEHRKGERRGAPEVTQMQRKIAQGAGGTADPLARTAPASGHPEEASWQSRSASPERL